MQGRIPKVLSLLLLLLLISCRHAAAQLPEGAIAFRGGVGMGIFSSSRDFAIQTENRIIRPMRDFAVFAPLEAEWMLDSKLGAAGYVEFGSFEEPEAYAEYVNESLLSAGSALRWHFKNKENFGTWLGGGLGISRMKNTEAPEAVYVGPHVKAELGMQKLLEKHLGLFLKGDLIHYRMKQQWMDDGNGYRVRTGEHAKVTGARISGGIFFVIY